MKISLVRASDSNVDEYIRIGKLNTSRFNTVATEREDVLKEFQGSIVYMIVGEGKTIGFVSYVVQSPEHVYVSEVQVEPDFRGQGIGGAVLSAVLKELDGFEIVDLHTHPENPAQRLYRRYKFETTGEIIENYHGSGEPRIRMILKRDQAN